MPTTMSPMPRHVSSHPRTSASSAAGGETSVKPRAAMSAARRRSACAALISAQDRGRAPANEGEVDGGAEAGSVEGVHQPVAVDLDVVLEPVLLGAVRQQ